MIDCDFALIPNYKQVSEGESYSSREYGRELDEYLEKDKAGSPSVVANRALDTKNPPDPAGS